MEEAKVINSLSQYEAIQFFLEKANLVQPGFALDSQNWSAVVGICQYLDGIPLALELAAARLKLLSVEEIAIRLHQSFHLLTGGGRAVLPRQQTLRASIDWSYDLLTEPEKLVLNRLSVFAGSWTLGAAETVCPEGEVKEAEVLELVTNLVDKSLIVVEEETEKKLASPKRLRLLEVIRQYARERLETRGMVRQGRERHLQYFSNLASIAASAIKKTGQVEWFKQLEAEHDNLRAALEWSLSADEADLKQTGLSMAYNLHWFWYVRGYESEGRQWLERALAVNVFPAGTYPPELARQRAMALVGAVLLSWGQHDYARALQTAYESLELYRQLNDKKGLAIAQGCVGIVLFSKGEIEQATELLNAAVAGLRGSGDDWYLAHFIYLKATSLLRQGENSAAQKYYEESLAIFREWGDQRWQGWILYSLAHIQISQRAYSEAMRLLEESRGLFLQVGDKRGLAWALQSLGSTAIYLNDYQKAFSDLQESLVRHRQQGSKAGLICGIEWRAALALAQNQFEQAVGLCGLAQTLRTSFTGRILQAIRANEKAILAQARSQLSPTSFEVALEQGAAMTIEQIINQDFV